RMNQGKEVRPFVYKNKGVMATIGRNRAVADLSGNLHLSGLIGWFFWMVVHLMYLVGFRNKAVVLTNWIWNYFTYDRGIRLILRPSTKTSDPISKEITQEMHESGK
ncbi:MAG: NAD(P)/FAD-dependent oxidoreductase, partial [Bacteroidales bacterium]